MRVVLDTNVCLDAFVFADPRAARLVAALASGEAEAVTRADCRDEWLAVLRYPALKLDEAGIAVAVARFDAAVTLLPRATAVETQLPVEASSVALAPIEITAATPFAETTTATLPRCRDPDDQKFLELAAASGAAVLFSRDAEVLRLGRRTKRDGLFAIMKPEDWNPVGAASAAKGARDIADQEPRR